MDYKIITNDVTGLVKETGAFIRENVKLITKENINSKGVHDFVTYVDQTSEKKLVKGLSVIIPHAGFIVEENTIDKKSSELNWVIDPLDGTTNYIHGLSPYSISVALMDGKEEVLLGVVYDPVADECFSASKYSPAFLNNEPIIVSSTPYVKDSLIATGFPYYDYIRIKPFLQTLEFFMTNSHGIRRLGSAAIDLAYVACGRFDAFYEYSLSPWDVAAGVLIVKQAGGKVSDFSGGQNFIFGREIIATNMNIFHEFSKKVGDIMRI
ncbi:MAG: inositol monophosphatase family protein [Bacteroidota bacterium]